VGDGGRHPGRHGTSFSSAMASVPRLRAPEDHPGESDLYAPDAAIFPGLLIFPDSE